MKKHIKKWLNLFLAMSILAASIASANTVSAELESEPGSELYGTLDGELDGIPNDEQSSDLNVRRTPFILCGDLEHYIENMIGRPFFTVCYAYVVDGKVISALMDREFITTLFYFDTDNTSTIKPGDCIAVEGVVGSADIGDDRNYINMQNCRLVSVGNEAEQLRQATTDSSYIPYLHSSPTVDKWIADKNLPDLPESSVQIGDMIGKEIQFGKYEQNFIEEDGQEDIEWIVLDQVGNQVLVLSKYVLDQAIFHNESTDTSWESSTLRYSLNHNFLTKYFTEEEQAMIVPTTVPADLNPEFSAVNAGNATQDKIFLLSTAEVEKYLPTPDDRLGETTELARARNLFDYAWWWLRTPGESALYASTITDDGSINNIGCDVTNFAVGARPAMWIDLGKKKQQ